MKHLHFNFSIISSVLAAALAICTLISASPAEGQDGIMKATIPFDFRAGSQRMPAGKYEIDRLSDSVILLRGPAEHKTNFLQVHSAQSSKSQDQGILVFNRYGDSYFLRQVWTAGSTIGQECSKSRTEKEASLAQSNHTPTRVELAVNVEPQR